MTGPHDAPSAPQLIEAVREWLEGSVATSPPGASDARLRFHARVAANMLAIVERELHLGPALAAKHQARLAALGCRDDAELAARIRDGSLDDRLEVVRRLVRESVEDKLLVANPGYLERSGRGSTEQSRGSE